MAKRKQMWTFEITGVTISLTSRQLGWLKYIAYRGEEGLESSEIGQRQHKMSVYQLFRQGLIKKARGKAGGRTRMYVLTPLGLEVYTQEISRLEQASEIVRGYTQWTS